MDPCSLVRKLFPTSRRLLVERSLKSLSIQNLESVIIIGAGYDPYRKLFPNAKRYMRIDIHPIKGKTDIAADALALPFREGTFECVLASEVVEHVKNPVLFVAELTRVLKLGGAAILTVPFMYHQHADPCDYGRYTSEALRNLLSGLRSVKINSQGNRLHVISDLVTTAWSPYPVLLPLRALNHLLVLVSNVFNTEKSTAPSGFLVVGRK